MRSLWATLVEFPSTRRRWVKGNSIYQSTLKLEVVTHVVFRAAEAHQPELALMKIQRHVGFE